MKKAQGKAPRATHTNKEPISLAQILDDPRISLASWERNGSGIARVNKVARRKLGRQDALMLLGDISVPSRRGRAT